MTRWAVRRHGRDALPATIGRQRIYILPTRFGIALALLLTAMLIAGLNYNSNLGLAFGFLMSSLAFVAMHHCHRNLLGLIVDTTVEVDAFAGGHARFEFMLRNESAVERCDIEVRCGNGAAATQDVPAQSYQGAAVNLPALARGVARWEHFEVRTRYPFGWFRAWTYVHSPLSAFVAPTPGGTLVLPAAAGSAGNVGRTDLLGDEEFAGLRAYQPGVPLKHMAWKVLARGGEAAVRSYTGSGARPEWLDWDRLAGMHPEQRLSQLCRWVLESENIRVCYGLRVPGIEIAPGLGGVHRSLCLRALAQYPIDAAL